MLYTAFFGLREEPFGVTPDPKFLYLSPQHQEAVASLAYGIANSRGFIMLTGAVGSGKTTVLRHVFYGLGPDVHTAMVLNPKMSVVELLKFINHDFGLKIKRTSTPKTLMDDLNAFLMKCHRSGEKAVLAIDETQEMSPECLEFVRLLSNLETDTNKLIQIILVGQPELRRIVANKRLRQLNQRIAVRYHLEPLSAPETAQYIRHRLKVAGSSTIDFPEKGVKAIHKFSRGVPRLINLACDRVLLASFANEEVKIRPGRIGEIIKELGKDDLTDAASAERNQNATPAPQGHAFGMRHAFIGLGLLLYTALILYIGAWKLPSVVSFVKSPLSLSQLLSIALPSRFKAIFQIFTISVL